MGNLHWDIQMFVAAEGFVVTQNRKTAESENDQLNYRFLVGTGNFASLPVASIRPCEPLQL